MQSYIVQSWEDEWLNDDSYQYTYDANGFIRIREKFENENWILKERETYTFSEFEEVGIFEIYEEEVWVNNERYSVIYDEFGSMTNYTVEYWEDENWIIDFDMKILLTYNGNNDIVEEIVQLWSTTYQIWFNAQRFDYYAFQYFELGDEENDLEARINIYPNPVTNTLSLDFNGELINEGVIQIFNEAGQKVFEDKLMGIHNKIDVSTLPNGMYLLRLKKNKNSVIHQKILKQ